MSQQVTHDGLLSSRRARGLEDELAKKLNSIVDIIKKDFLITTEHFQIINPTIPTYPDKRQFEIVKPIRLIRYELKPETRDAIRPEVYAIIRSYYQQAYILGANHAALTFETELYMSTNDVQRIKSASEEYTERFILRMDDFVRYLERKANKKYEEYVMTPEIGPKSINYLMTQLAEVVIWNAISMGTLEKATALAEDEYTDIHIQNDARERIKRRSTYNRVRKYRINFRLITASDDRVCKKECLPISKEVYTIQDYRSGRIKSTPIHQNCRCRYLIFRET